MAPSTGGSTRAPHPRDGAAHRPRRAFFAGGMARDRLDAPAARSGTGGDVLSVPFQIYSRSVCRNQQVARRLSAPEAFVAPREQAIRRIGVVTVTAAVCGCGRRVEPADFEA